MNSIKIFFVTALALASFTMNAQHVEKWKLADLQNAVNHGKGPVILNFWASFCKPCLQEIPYFQEAVEKESAVQLILVSLDLPEAYDKLEAFAKKHAITARIVFLEETNADIFCPVVHEKWSGAMPASLFINNKTGYRKFFEDKIPEEKFKMELAALVAEK
jgi:thiol-disulfide isomerase/thioredoxin